MLLGYKRISKDSSRSGDSNTPGDREHWMSPCDHLLCNQHDYDFSEFWEYKSSGSLELGTEGKSLEAR